MHFSVNESSPPPAALLVGVTDEGDARPVFIWSAVSTASWYYVWVRDSNTQSGDPRIAKWVTPQTAGCGSGTGECSWKADIHLAEGDATVWINTWNEAVGSGNLGPWSNGGEFTVSAPVISGYQIVSEDFTLSAGQTHFEVVYCPAGKLAVSGGILVPGSRGSLPTVVEAGYTGILNLSRLTSGWVERFTNFEKEEINIRHRAVCIDPPVGYEVNDVQISLPANTHNRYDATCSQDKVVLGSGVAFESSGTRIEYTIPSSSGGVWTFGVTNTTTEQLNGAHRIICSPKPSGYENNRKESDLSPGSFESRTNTCSDEGKSVLSGGVRPHGVFGNNNRPDLITRYNYPSTVTVVGGVGLGDVLDAWATGITNFGDESRSIIERNVCVD